MNKKILLPGCFGKGERFPDGRRKVALEMPKPQWDDLRLHERIFS